MATSKHRARKPRAAKPEPTLDEMANFPAAIDDKTMMKMEAAAGSRSNAQARRLALVALARSAAQLAEMSMSDPDLYGKMRSG